jgi:hypothetical protein
MTTVSIPVGSQPFLKSSERPVSRIAGEAISVMDPVYLKASDGKYYVANSDPTTPETSVVAGIAITKSETDSYVLFVSQPQTIIDFGGSLTAGANYWLAGQVLSDAYSDITSTHYVSKLGFCDEAGDFRVLIANQSEVK